MGREALLGSALNDTGGAPRSTADSPIPIQSAVTVLQLQIVLQIVLRTALRPEIDVDVFEVFFCERPKKRSSCRGLWFL